MILGVLSDTHSLVLPSKMLDAFKNASLIVHAGDVCDKEVIKALEAIAPVKAVQGNMDDADIKKKFPLKEIFEVEGVRVGIAHGHVGTNRDAFINAQELFKSDTVDLVIFGHSHKPLSTQVGKTLYFNPGSPNDVIKAPYFSYGLIELKGGRIVKSSIVKV